MTGDLEREALRVYRRYQTEIVEGLSLCPWAARAREDGSVREQIIVGEAADAQAVLSAIHELGEDTSVEIGLLIFPTLALGRADFERFVASINAQDAALHEIGEAPFAMAAFHHDSPADTEDGERLVPFVRRTPDPTIQLVRRSALERVREGFAEGTAFVDVRFLSTLELTADDTLPLRERIARANLRTVERLGVSEVEARLNDILRDRNEAYARFGVAPREPCRSS